MDGKQAKNTPEKPITPAAARASEPFAPEIAPALDGDLLIRKVPPARLAPQDLLRMQRTVGNRSVQRLLANAGRQPARNGRPPGDMPFGAQPLTRRPLSIQLCPQCARAMRGDGELCPACQKKHLGATAGWDNQDTGLLQRAWAPAGLGDRSYPNRDRLPLAELAPRQVAPPAYAPSLVVAPNRDGHTMTFPDIQRNILGDAWDAATAAGSAAIEAARLVSTVVSDPTRLVMVVAAVSWDALPESVKGPLLNKILEVALSLARVVTIPDPPGVPLPLGRILQHAAIGFLERALSYPSGMKVKVADRVGKLITNPSLEFAIGFLQGLVSGLWDGLTGPFILLWDLIKIGWEIQKAQMRFLFEMLQKEKRNQYEEDVKAALTKIEASLTQVVSQLMAGKTNPLAIMNLIDNLVSAALKQVESVGSSLADSMLKFMNRPDGPLGEGLGWVAGVAGFEILLLVLTDGGYTLVKEAVQGMKVVVRLAEIGADAWKALGPVRAALTRFRAFAAGNKALGPLVEAVEEVFALLVKYLRFSYGGGSAGAGARAGEHGSATAERTAAREIRVSETATRETHEITLLPDGRLIRCSDTCIQMAESIIERSGRLNKAGLESEGGKLVGEAQKIADEARLLKANDSLSSAERAAREDVLLRRAEALERQMATAEQKLMNALQERADNAFKATSDLMRNNAGNPRLGQFRMELETLEADIVKNRQLAHETLDPDMRKLVEDEFDVLERKARDLETRMRDQLPAAPVAAEQPAFVRENRVPFDHETILANGDRFSRTGKDIKGAQIYRDADGHYYHRDTLHKGAGAEIEHYDAGAKHLGSLDPVTGAPKGPAVKGRTLDRYL